MAGSRIPWMAEGPSSNEVAFEPSMSGPWAYEGQYNGGYGQPGAYPVNSHTSHHTRTPSLGYGMVAPAGIDTSTGAYYGQHPAAGYNVQQALHHHQPGVDQYGPYQNHAQQAYQSLLPASSITEGITSREPISARPPQPTRSTLRFVDLEPWMDIDYFNGVCGVMGWENVILKVPAVGTQSLVNGSKPNNPGYCFMTFTTADAAIVALAACCPPKSVKLMPNSKRPFNVVWALVPSSSPRGLSTRDSEAENDQRMMAGLFAEGSLSLCNPTAPGSPPQDDASASDPSAGRALEYSIFVGDLAPETTSARLTAVFRDPVLGLRLDREPKYVAPFTSCKSSKIMTDPVLGTSKGYAFVRFGSARDASRAMIEMQGLYCETRPMRISHATEKDKKQGYTHPETLARNHASYGTDYSEHATYSNLMSGTPVQHGRPMSGPGDLAISTAHQSNNGQAKLSPNDSSRGSPSPTFVMNAHQHQHQQTPGREQSADPLERLPKETLDVLAALSNTDVFAQLLRLAAKPSGQENSSPGVRDGSGTGVHSAAATTQKFSSGEIQLPPRGLTAIGSHPGLSPRASTARPARPITITPGPMPSNQQTQARALLASMVGANGAVQNSTDPYNTTVFVGGLSGLISEETLRSFFGEYGEIHYVKIPPGKGCGFVQFVKKADAEAAIEGLQGYSIGGGRVRLSWGRSQYKAAQAAAQAAQLGINIGQPCSLQALSDDHAARLLQSLGLSPGNIAGSVETRTNPHRGGYPQSSAVSPYGIGGVTGQSDYVNRGLPAIAPGANDFSDSGSHISRSQTFPSFAPLGSDTSTYGGSMLAPSRSTVDMNALQPSQFDARYQLPTQGVRGNVSQPGLDTNSQNALNGYAYYDPGSNGAYAQRGGYRSHEPNRKERAGSDSTVQTDPSITDSYEIINCLSDLNLSHDASDNFDRDPSEYQYHPTGSKS